MNEGRWHPQRKFPHSKMLQPTYPWRKRPMTVFRKPIKTICVILLLVVAVMFMPYSTEAGVKKIWPDKFIPLNNSQNSVQLPFKVSSNTGGSAAFYVDLKLPVGAKIKKLVYYHWGALTAGTSVSLHRQKLGKDTSPGLMLALSDDHSYQIVKVTNLPPDPAADLVVRKGYRYFLAIISLNSESEIHGIRVSYK
jgi:hypothetical protein